ncbi:tetratricopeptide repeat protein [Paenactinomyces guangxiensis]|uniref:Helix-turn-helix transcriptional regulator n=1 Tax=Paenactinomyces guangxiensis TaxID=1490290 RepID=A0A7W1WQN5_9BACL|nr:helix-turn-helix transcriptional regulator [Paenactinomyces guangxiensis]MBA4494173.1 helix-turn-helix transcriptional regulator [Paenactinomyces guangxiensis]MBH8591082.1 helix-turn-helix transcriptional regulator [Paenactinomyces guangxiensis]
MYYGLEPSIVRYVIRRVRKEKNLRQEDLSDNKMSYGTISNIERGVNNVDESIVLRYLAKLMLTQKKLKALVTEEQERIESLAFQLEYIESMFDHGKPKEAEKLLKQLSLERYHPLAPYFTYLEGRNLQAKKQFKKAKKQYEFAIRLHNQYKLFYRGNIVSICYNELSICSYTQNEIEKALDYVEKGLAACDENREGKEIKYPLMSNKILYLLNMYQYDAAKQILDELWTFIPQIRNIFTILNIYKFRAIILRKMKMYTEAIDVCREGIDIARRNQVQNRYLDLINVLGSIYLLQAQLEKAMQCFDMVANYDRDQHFPRNLIDALTYLAIIHSHKKCWKDAEQSIEQALDIAKGNSHYRLSKVLIVRGDILSAQNKFKEAIPFYQESEQIAEKNGFKRRQCTALLQLATCFGNMGLDSECSKCMVKLLNLKKELKLYSEDDIYAIDA